MTLGTKLHALRSAKGLSLRQVKAGSGVSASTLSRAERDIGIPDTIILSMLAKFYDVPLHSLLDAYEPTPEQTEEFLIGLGYNLDELRAEINALITELSAHVKAILGAKGSKS